MSKPISDTDGSSNQPAKNKLDGQRLRSPAQRTSPIVERKNQTSEPGQPKASLEREMRQRPRVGGGEMLFHRLASAFTRSLFAIVVVAFLGAIIWFFVFASEDKNTVERSNREQDIASNFDDVLQSNDPAPLLKYLAEQEVDVARQPLPLVVSRLKEKILIGRRLETLNADESSTIIGLQTQLDCLIIRDILNISHSLNDEAGHQELVETANRLLNHGDVKISRKAQLALNLPAMHVYLKDNSDENFEKVETLVLNSIKDQLDDANAITSLEPIFNLIAQSKRPDQVSRFRMVVGNLLKTSQLPKVFDYGATLHDEMLIGDIDFPELSRQILSEDEAALAKLDQTVRTVASSDKASAVPVAKLISLIENLDQIGKAEQEVEYIEMLRNANRDGSNLKNKELIENAFVDYDKRKSLPGNKFDLTIEDKSIDMEGTQGNFVVLMFYSSQNFESMSGLDRLNDLSYLKKMGMEFVACCADSVTDENAQLKIAQAFPQCILLTRSMAPSYFDQCPVVRVPYILVLDREHRVVATNVDVDQLRLKLEGLFKD